MSPLDELYTGLENEIQIEELDERVVVSGYWRTQRECFNLGISPFIMVIGQPILGCAKLYVKVDGVHRCDIFMAYDWEWIYEHEHRH